MKHYECLFCKKPSGTYIICRPCQSCLTKPQAKKATVVWHQEVFERDKHTCTYCGKVHDPVEDLGAYSGDHKRTKKAYPELRYDVRNGRTTCNFPCHALRHEGVYDPFKTLKQNKKLLANKKSKKTKSKPPAWCTVKGCTLLGVVGGKCLQHMKK